MQDISSMRVFYATIVGLVVGAVISSVTEYYTGLGTKPVMAIVQKSSTGAGTNVIAGLATGMISTFPTVYCLLLQFGLLTRLQDFME
jgi:K(+)-stimulated pyrophosphate-energized sodium pump